MTGYRVDPVNDARDVVVAAGAARRKRNAGCSSGVRGSGPAAPGPSPRSFLASLSHKQRGRGDRSASTKLVVGLGATAVLASLGGGARGFGAPRKAARSPLQRAFAVPAAGFDLRFGVGRIHCRRRASGRRSRPTLHGERSAGTRKSRQTRAQVPYCAPARCRECRARAETFPASADRAC